jgi:hypothetical protein
LTRYILREHENKIFDYRKQHWDYYNSKFARKKDNNRGKNIWDRWAGAAVLSMKMKVHQTLVWLNLLSFGTRDLTEPTIGIRSAVVEEARAKSGLSAENSYAANHLTKTFTDSTLLRNFVSTPQRSHCPAVTELSSVPLLPDGRILGRFVVYSVKFCICV